MLLDAYIKTILKLNPGDLRVLQWSADRPSGTNSRAGFEINLCHSDCGYKKKLKIEEVLHELNRLGITRVYIDHCSVRGYDDILAYHLSGRVTI